MKTTTKQVMKGTEVYDQLNILIELLQENKLKKKVPPKERVYLFNELDLLLAEGVDIRLLTKCAEYRKNGLNKIASWSDFDIEIANGIEYATGFLQELELYLNDSRIATKYEYYVDGKVIIPSKEQQELVKNYLKQNNVVLNELTYSLALRRLVIGGDVESKFAKDYFVQRAKEFKKEKGNAMNI